MLTTEIGFSGSQSSNPASSLHWLTGLFLNRQGYETDFSQYPFKKNIFLFKIFISFVVCWGTHVAPWRTICGSFHLLLWGSQQSVRLAWWKESLPTELSLWTISWNSNWPCDMMEESPICPAKDRVWRTIKRKSFVISLKAFGGQSEVCLSSLNICTLTHTHHAG